MSFLGRIKPNNPLTGLKQTYESVRSGDFEGAAKGIVRAGGYGEVLDQAEALRKRGQQELSKYDPTAVRKADVSRVKGVSEEAARRARQMFDRPVERYQVGDIAAQQIGALPGRSSLEQMLGVARGNIAQAGQIDPSVAQFLQASTQQGQLDPAVALARQAALGEAPSAAQAQLQAGVDQSIAAQMASAASGGGGAAAVRGAQQQAAVMQQQAANQAAALRAQEMAQARQLYGGLAGQQAAQQIGALQGAAGLQLSADELSGAQRQAAINAALSGSQAAAAQDLQQATVNAQQALEAQKLQEMFNMQALQQQQQAQLGYAGLGAGLMGQQSGMEQFLAQLEAARLGQVGALRGQAFGAGMEATGNILSQLIAQGGSAAKTGAMAAGGGA